MVLPEFDKPMNMKTLVGACTLIALSSGLPRPLVPVADYHQHLFSPAVAAFITANPTPGAPPAKFQGISAADLIGLLDAAGIKRALVLSVAYTWGSADRRVDNEYEHVKAENDWTARQVALYPDRLRAFCGFNPIKPYALEELHRCATIPQLRRGIKLHLGNSDVDLDNSQDVAKVRDVFQAANTHKMAIVVHMHPSVSHHRQYGAAEAQIVLEQLLSAAPDVSVQIAHLAGAGGYDPTTDAALSVFVDAFARHDPRVRNVWFDVTSVVRPGISADVSQLVAKRIREIGLRRVLYGSDAATGGNLTPREGWAAFRTLPLTDAEFRTIALNVPPYMRW